MQNAECRMQNAECRMQNAECRMQNAEVSAEDMYGYFQCVHENYDEEMKMECYNSMHLMGRTDRHES